MNQKSNTGDHIKAVLLLSGGLDSTLAAKMMKDQGVDLFALNMVTPFCTCTRKGCLSEARKVSEKLSIPLKIMSGGEDYIQIVKHPRFGYGKQLNPCIDCRVFIFSRAKDLMEEIGARFVVTGEVLGERPMSQRLSAMHTIEKASGLDGLVLRPLSARLLKPSIPEIEGWVKREKLLDIRGRSRKPQMNLAENIGIDDYPCPAGGCRLTDFHFAGRLRDLFAHAEDTMDNIQLLKYGRHFRLPSGAKAIVGRNEHENGMIEGLANPNSFLLECAGTMVGPICLLCNSQDDADVVHAGSITLKYSDHPDSAGRIKVWTKSGKSDKVIECERIKENELVTYRI